MESPEAASNPLEMPPSPTLRSLQRVKLASHSAIKSVAPREKAGEASTRAVTSGTQPTRIASGVHGAASGLESPQWGAAFSAHSGMESACDDRPWLKRLPDTSLESDVCDCASLGTVAGVALTSQTWTETPTAGLACDASAAVAAPNLSSLLAEHKCLAHTLPPTAAELAQTRDAIATFNGCANSSLARFGANRVARPPVTVSPSKEVTFGTFGTSATSVTSVDSVTSGAPGDFVAAGDSRDFITFGTSEASSLPHSAASLLHSAASLDHDVASLGLSSYTTDTQPLVGTPFPLLANLHASAASSDDDMLLVDASPNNLGPLRPGYATPMRTSVVELMPLLHHPSAHLDDESDVSADSLPSTPETPSLFSNPIQEYRRRNMMRTPEKTATAGDVTASRGLSSSDAAPGSAPSKLSHKPKLNKVRSALDGIGATAPTAPTDPFKWIKPNAETSWDTLLFESSVPLGDGNEGNVLLARFHGVQVAVKVGHHERILKEQKMMSKLSHERVLRTLGYSHRPATSIAYHPQFSDPDVTVEHAQNTYAAIYEYCAHKDLMTYLSTSNSRSDVVKMTQIFDDILAGLEYIHDGHPHRATHGPIVHGDVKPENVMINHEGRAKLGDFGLAQYMSPNMDVQGTPSYIAPEIVLDFINSAVSPTFTTKADIFSFGVLMVVALTGHYPFKRLTARLHSGQMTVAQVIKHFTPSRRSLKTINDISPRFKRMVDACLCRYPEMRPSAAQLRGLLFRRSQSTGQDGVPPATLVRAASSITKSQLEAFAASNKADRSFVRPVVDSSGAPLATKLEFYPRQATANAKATEVGAGDDRLGYVSVSNENGRKPAATAAKGEQKVPSSLHHIVYGPQPMSIGKVGDEFYEPK